MIRGVDISHHQPAVNAGGLARAGIAFAYLKATDGARDARGRLYVDPTCSDRARAIAGAGLAVGLYHFARPGRNTAATEAAHFSGVHAQLAGVVNLPPVLDLEQAGATGPATVGWALDWIRLVEAATGRRPMIYTGPAFCDGLGSTADQLAGWPLWVAHYTTQPEPRLPRAWRGRGWALWQYTSSGRVAGVSGPCDVNRSELELAQLLQLANPTGEPMPDPNGRLTDLERDLLIRATADRVKRLEDAVFAGAPQLGAPPLAESITYTGYAAAGVDLPGRPSIATQLREQPNPKGTTREAHPPSVSEGPSRVAAQSQEGPSGAEAAQLEQAAPAPVASPAVAHLNLYLSERERAAVDQLPADVNVSGRLRAELRELLAEHGLAVDLEPETAGA